MSSEITAPWWLLTAHQKDWHAHKDSSADPFRETPQRLLLSWLYSPLRLTLDVRRGVTKRPSSGVGDFHVTLVTYSLSAIVNSADERDICMRQLLLMRLVGVWVMVSAGFAPHVSVCQLKDTSDRSAGTAWIRDQKTSSVYCSLGTNSDRI